MTALAAIGSLAGPGGLGLVSKGVATALKVGGTVLGAVGQYQEGKAQQAQLKFQAKQKRQKAGQERAVGQHRAIERRRRARILKSQAIARAAAGGGKVTDPSVTNIIAGLLSEGEYAAQGETYAAEERARGLETSAEADIYQGKQAVTGAFRRAGGTLLAGFSDIGSDLTEKYAPGPAPGFGSDYAPDYGITNQPSYSDFGIANKPYSAGFGIR